MIDVRSGRQVATVAESIMIRDVQRSPVAEYSESVRDCFCLPACGPSSTIINAHVTDPKTVVSYCRSRWTTCSDTMSVALADLHVLDSVMVSAGGGKRESTVIPGFLRCASILDSKNQEGTYRCHVAQAGAVTVISPLTVARTSAKILGG